MNVYCIMLHSNASVITVSTTSQAVNTVALESSIMSFVKPNLRCPLTLVKTRLHTSNQFHSKNKLSFSLKGRTGHEMGICHISKTTGPVYYVFEKKVTCDMVNNFYDYNHGNLITLSRRVASDSWRQPWQLFSIPLYLWHIVSWC